MLCDCLNVENKEHRKVKRNIHNLQIKSILVKLKFSKGTAFYSKNWFEAQKVQGTFDPFTNKTPWGTKMYNYTSIMLEPKISGMGQMLNKKDPASRDKNKPS